MWPVGFEVTYTDVQTLAPDSYLPSTGVLGGFFGYPPRRAQEVQSTFFQCAVSPAYMHKRITHVIKALIFPPLPDLSGSLPLSHSGQIRGEHLWLSTSLPIAFCFQVSSQDFFIFLIISEFSFITQGSPGTAVLVSSFIYLILAFWPILT